MWSYERPPIAEGPEMGITLAAIGLGLSVWLVCWDVGRRRDDQELCESGVALGVIAAAVGVLLAYAYVLTASPMAAEMLALGIGVRELVVLIAGSASVAMVVTGIVALFVEYWLAEQGRIEHEGLLLEQPLERIGVSTNENQ